ncbi:MAG: Holliday junction resolvase RuvX [Gammaproteobacteria bacterium]|nr:Holliday junction resolvase RuvX [Gammaproteobacteria bacterium]MDE0251986.1 Holliday junction resolvase RuvX [Gammaproteobacteria bacterium]
MALLDLTMSVRRLALSFDFGKKHIGVASIEVSSRTINPKGIVKANNGRPNLPQLDFIVQTWKPTDLVVGLPLHMDARPSTMSRAAQKFGTFLEKRFDLPVHYVDERLSSDEAARRSEEDEPDHALAAVVIGESWLHEIVRVRR